MRVHIRRMKEEDLPDVMVLDALCFRSPWSRATYLSELARGKAACYLVAEHHDKVVGYVGSWIVGKEMHVTTIGVDPDYRRKRIAERMMLAVVEEAWRRNLEEITLEYAVSNAAAESLYEKFGFAREGLRKGYYQDSGEDAVIATVRRLKSPVFRQCVETIRAAIKEQELQEKKLRSAEITHGEED